MSKNVRTVNGQRGSQVSVPGIPCDIALSGSTLTVWYETKANTNYVVREYHSYDNIPDDAGWLARIGSEPNASYYYFSRA